jgi:hypothetical protein
MYNWHVNSKTALDFKAKVDKLNLFNDTGLFINPENAQGVQLMAIGDYLANGGNPEAELLYVIQLNGLFSSVGMMISLFGDFTFGELKQLYQSITNGASFGDAVFNVPGVSAAVDSVLAQYK